jgi:hypothetical protein
MNKKMQKGITVGTLVGILEVGRLYAKSCGLELV